MKKLFQSIILVFLLFINFITPVHADMGPKPSVTISFKGIDEEYYVTLLSDLEQYGPWQKQDELDSDGAIRKSIWEKFNNYEDEYYFIGHFEECTNSHEFIWGYHPPEYFKILIYYPESDTFMESEILERYAFDSYFEVRVDHNQFDIEIKYSYNFKKEIKLFLFRLITTILIELLFIDIFKLTSKKQKTIIILTNIVTQIFLNIGLNFLILLHHYLLFETFIIIIEAISYKYFMKDVKNSTVWSYSILANTVSFFMGIIFAVFLRIF